MRARSIVVVLCLANLCTGAALYGAAVPLENAYWRFEEGVNGTIVPQGPDTVLDSINEFHMSRWTAGDGDPDRAAPSYTTDVPAPIIPQTGQPNTLALRFQRHAGGGDDIYSEVDPDKPSDSKDAINWPEIENGFTLEASFKVTFAGGGDGDYQGIVCKEGAILNGLPRLALKVRADDARLQIEMFDGSETARGVRSIDPIVPGQWYHAAVVNDGSNLSLYLKIGDGNYDLQGTDIITGGALAAGKSHWVIGRAQFYNGAADWTDGIIDEVRLSNHVLDPTEFLFAAGFGPGDFNRDGSVDVEDMILFINCATGPAILYNPASPPVGCTLTAVDGLLSPDLDEDGDIDSTDFAIFQTLLGS